MRLNQRQREVIRDAVYRRDPGAKIVLFGSRADDVRRGGDIDLLVLSRHLQPADRRAIKLDLYKQIGAQKIDLLVAADARRPFIRMILQEGVSL